MTGEKVYISIKTFLQHLQTRGSRNNNNNNLPYFGLLPHLLYSSPNSLILKTFERLIVVNKSPKPLILIKCCSSFSLKKYIFSPLSPSNCIPQTGLVFREFFIKRGHLKNACHRPLLNYQKFMFTNRRVLEIRKRVLNWKSLVFGEKNIA